MESKHEHRMDNRPAEKQSDIGATKPQSCLHASSLQLLTMPALSIPVVSCCLFSAAIYPRYHFSSKVAWNEPWTTPPKVHNEKTDRANEAGTKTNNKCIRCTFWQSQRANVVTNADPRSIALECAKGSLGFCLCRLERRWEQFQALWQLKPPTPSLRADPRVVPDVNPRGQCAGSWRLAHHAKANMVARCAYSIH